MINNFLLYIYIYIYIYIIIIIIIIISYFILPGTFWYVGTWRLCNFFVYIFSMFHERVMCSSKDISNNALKHMFKVVKSIENTFKVFKIYTFKQFKNGTWFIHKIKILNCSSKTVFTDVILFNK